ncbi:MAG: sulfide/dihydroorotate dehydrogenase-like FAD/NAD-binding protein [Nitrospinaceae bacterium]|nr:MAG: sulfide/dihydroorotate dehydrogenase-like FAD/NAD-binding protein [Nitrospinaceae bacterium]
MFNVIAKDELAPGVFRFVVEAPQIARKARPGQFVILRLNEHGERIPLTIANHDEERGTLTLFVQAVGKTSLDLSRLEKDQGILDIAGPLGLPTEIERFGTVALVGGGFGIAALWPIARALTAIGNKTIALMGARSKNLLLLQEEMHAAASEVRVATNDGSAGMRGLVTDLLDRVIRDEGPVHRVIAIGPVVMMKAVCALTRAHNIPTRVSLNPIMIDGTGMCGACRVMVDGKMRFTCVDGPEFDGHLVDFEGLENRLRGYLPEEQQARERLTGGQECRLDTTGAARSQP